MGRRAPIPMQPLQILRVIENVRGFSGHLGSFHLRPSLAANRGGFTLIELVIVIAIIGILSSLAIPKFLDLSAGAKISATKAGLGSLRAALAIKYASSATGGATATYPATMTSADFSGSELPKNGLSTNSGVNPLAATVGGTTTHATLGFWYVTATTDMNTYGRAGAYTSSTATDTSAY